MTAGEWIALLSLFIVILISVVGGAVYIVRELGILRGEIASTVRDHEHDCVNYEPNTAVQIKALRKG